MVSNLIKSGATSSNTSHYDTSNDQVTSGSFVSYDKSNIGVVHYFPCSLYESLNFIGVLSVAKFNLEFESSGDRSNTQD